MTEAAKNRVACAAIAVASTALCAAIAAQWLPGQHKIAIETGQTFSTIATTAVSETTQRVNLNSASYEELLSLPAMTETLALSVLEHRYLCRSFTSWDDLLKIDGVTAAMVEGWKTHAFFN